MKYQDCDWIRTWVGVTVQSFGFVSSAVARQKMSRFVKKKAFVVCFLLWYERMTMNWTLPCPAFLRYDSFILPLFQDMSLPAGDMNNLQREKFICIVVSLTEEVTLKKHSTKTKII